MQEEDDEDDYSNYETTENFMLHKNLFQAGNSSYKRGKMVAETEVKKRPSMAKLTQSRRSKED